MGMMFGLIMRGTPGGQAVPDATVRRGVKVPVQLLFYFNPTLSGEETHEIC